MVVEELVSFIIIWEVSRLFPRQRGGFAGISEGAYRPSQMLIAALTLFS
jgi:hypothetical protein